MTVKLGNVLGSTKNDGTNHTAGTPEEPPGLTAYLQPASKLPCPKVQLSPANVDTSIFSCPCCAGLYLNEFGWFAYVLMYSCSTPAWLAAEHGMEDMSKEKNRRNGVALFALNLNAAEYAFAICEGCHASAPRLSAKASMPLDAASAMSATRRSATVNIRNQFKNSPWTQVSTV